MKLGSIIGPNNGLSTFLKIRLSSWPILVNTRKLRIFCLPHTIYQNGSLIKFKSTWIYWLPRIVIWPCKLRKIKQKICRRNIITKQNFLLKNLMINLLKSLRWLSLRKVSKIVHQIYSCLKITPKLWSVFKSLRCLLTHKNWCRREAK